MPFNQTGRISRAIVAVAGKSFRLADYFSGLLDRVWRKPDEDRKSRAGRKPIDTVLMFKTLVLSALYNLSDDQIEYQVRDRL